MTDQQRKARLAELEAIEIWCLRLQLKINTWRLRAARKESGAMPKSPREGYDLLELPPVEWEATVDKMNSGEIQEFESLISAICERAARLSGYLDARGAAGCGDGGHELGVANSNRKAARVRKALGFNQARSDIRF